MWRQAQVLRAWSRCQRGHQEAGCSGMAWSMGPSGRRSFRHGLVHGAIRTQVLLARLGPWGHQDAGPSGTARCVGPSGRRSFGHGSVRGAIRTQVLQARLCAWGRGLPAPTLCSALALAALSVLAERAVECASAPSCPASEAGLGDCARSQSGCGSVSRVQPFVRAVTGVGALTDWLLLGSTDLPA